MARIYYGWWVVAAFSVVTFTSTGIRHAVGPFLKPIVADLGIDRATFSIVIAISLFLWGVFMPIAGKALDRFGTRPVAVTGTLLVALSLVLTSMVQNLWQFAVFRALLGLGMGGEWASGAALVSETWPTKHRGRALGFMQSSWAIGFAVAAMVVGFVLPRWGWRAVFFVGILPAFFTLWVRRNVEEPQIWHDARRARA